jgi:DNA-binding MarR family transcriptional regulator/N-acetylglutamate synthase-like GNAT family acetyltransferase
MSSDDFDQRIAAVRRFNRFYTRQIGVLQRGHLETPFSLTEARVLYELAHHERPTASDVGKELRLDAGYLSRLLTAFEKRQLVSRETSPADGRQAHLRLTKRGRDAFASLDRRAREEVAAFLGPLSSAEQCRVVDAMQSVELLLGPRQETRASYVLRPHRPGDMGWVVHRHGALYAEEYGFDDRFEALVAEIVAHFIRHFDPKRERCWIAERDGQIVGSVFLVSKTKTVSKLRLLLVEPSARGLGIGNRLVDECIRFARQAGYRRMTLYTQKSLRAARHIYQKAGFRLVHQERHRDFGPPQIAETWDLDL